jgi:membrane protein required for colicin V production
MQDISMFDIIIVAITFLLGLKGLFRGFIKEVFGLIGIVGGIFVASRAAKDIGDLIAPLLALDNESTIKLIGFIAGLVGFWIIIYLIGMILSKMSSMSGLGIIDRIFGFIFGAGKVFLIVSIIVYALSQVNVFKEKLETNFGKTVTYPLLLDVGAYIIKLDLAKTTTAVEKSVDEAVKASKEAVSEVTKEVIKEKTEEVIEAVKQNSKEIAAEVKQTVEQSVETVSKEVKQKAIEVEKVVDKEIKEAKEEIK